MYPEELKKYIDEHNGILGGDELDFATSIKEHPQINHIKYDPYGDKFKMWDKYGNYYEFTPMKYNDAKQKGLVKRR